MVIPYCGSFVRLRTKRCKIRAHDIRSVRQLSRRAIRVALSGAQRGAASLTRRLIILIGENDCDPHAHDLPRGEIAKAQGPHRLARGQWYFGHCTDLAARLGVALGWRHEVVPGAGHVSQEIYDRASDILAE